MTLSLSQNYTAICANRTASFLGTGGTAPYTYSLVTGGAGGSIDASTGVYTAPLVVSSDLAQVYDLVVVTDAAAATASSAILVGTPLLLFADIIQTCLGLEQGRVYLWDQKIFSPTDYDLFIAVSVPLCKSFGNNNITQVDDSGNVFQAQYTNMWAQVDIDIISRGPAARDRKEEVILALFSNYAEAQQEANSFKISRVSKNFINLSNIDGAAIPYRYKISCAMQYCVSITSPIPYFGDFPGFTIATND